VINDLDNVLRQLLLREVNVKNNRIDVTFDQPKREWSAKLNRATLNLFLYDVRENSKLRQTRPAWDATPHNGDSVSRQRRPVRVDLHYMLTAWAAEPDDEHYLLTLALLALFRTPELPLELLPERLQEQPVPICLMVAQEDTLRNPAEIWSAMNNELRPSIPVVVTLAFNPYAPSPPIKLVKERGLRVEPGLDWLFRERDPDEVERNADKYRWTVGGLVRTKQPLDQLSLTLVERGQAVPLPADGRFVIGNLVAGQYTLEITAPGRQARRYTLTVPGPDQEFKF
jgi:hypothetical protein